MTFAATMILNQAPTSGAILANVQASASGLPIPLNVTGGAIVVQRNLPDATVPFMPGTPATLHSQDGMVTVQFPPNAYTQPLTLRHSVQPGPDNLAAPDLAGRKRGLRSFYLNAVDPSGNQVHQFSAPLTVTVSYTPQQLAALGISEQDASLFWYDEHHSGGAQWVSIGTQIDDVSHTATSVLSHFSGFTLSDGSSPSAAFVPSLQGWQVGLYSGDVSYQFPIDVPAGPGGIKPNLALTYDSSATDGDTGTRQKQQSGWVGKGWSLDTGYVALNRLPAENDVSRYYTLVFDGQSFDLVRGEPRVQTPHLSNPTEWEWHPTNENFIRARAEVQSPLAGRGYGASGTRYMWKVWAKDGTRYDFMEDAWQGFVDCTAGKAFLETYKWYLSRVVDTNRNVITYHYDNSRLSEAVPQECVSISGTTDYSVWPTSVTWGSNSGVSGSVDRYELEFVSSARTIDTDYDRSTSQIGRAPQETRRLDQLNVYSMQNSTWELVRAYRFNYETNPANYLLSDYSDGNNLPDTTHTKLTLNSITRLGKDGTAALPDISFTYGHSRGTGYYPAAEWNRLTGVNNGQGGTITFAYQNIGSAIGNNLFRNYRRVTTKTVTDGRGHSYQWSYTYLNPALNSLGTSLNAGDGPNVYPNSASIYYNDYYTGSYNTSNEGISVHQRKKEFRGHSYATETDPNGNVTEHFFYQGDTNCTPAAVGDNCYNNMLTREFLKGKEYDTVVHSGSSTTGPKLSETQHAYNVTSINQGLDAYADDRLTGLWRAFSYENQTTETAWEGGGIALNKITNYEYDTSYGNLTAEEERDTNNTLLRRTEHSYAQNISSDGYWYIVDRRRSDNVFDGAHNWLAKTVYAYDGSYGSGTITNGNLTLVRKYYNLTVPPSPNLPSAAYSSDTSFGYDAYGNRTTETTYSLQGELTNGSTWSQPGCSVAYGCGAARITTTTYDTIFHALPTRIDPPPVNGVTLSQQASYDYRMGLITSVTDPNGTPTYQEYDGFGRWTKLIKYGDSSSLPTASVAYYDYELPVRYRVDQQEVSGDTSKSRMTQHYYDGLGREIQTKAQSAFNCAQNIVTDKVYDGLGQLTQQSTPRYVDTTNGCVTGAFFTYVTPGSPSVENWTTTLYDALGRTTRVTSPDNTYSIMTYSVDLDNGAYVHTTATYDPNSHKTQHISDVFGRLIRVKEFSGNSGRTYSLDSTTNYAYNPLDLLTTVTLNTGNGGGNTTTIGYDSLGRKLDMQDVTMGHWTYQYDVNGNLKTQTDAKNQQIQFGYDALDRLTTKTYPDTSTIVYNYDETASSYGKGQRTSTQRGGTSGITTRWQFDNRGRQTSATYRVPGLSGTGSSRTISYAYDTADRQTSITYPTGEVVTYGYDAAWRQTQVCSSSLGGCYAQNASYTALAQPLSMQVGSATQTYTYSPSMQRLASLKVNSALGGDVFFKSYGYDAAGNVASITNNVGVQQVNTYTYDHRDRLTDWKQGGATQMQMSYDTLGNITSKGGTTYSYGPGNGGPHAVRSTTLSGNTTTYTYDANGNTTGSAQGKSNVRTFTYNYDNQPSAMVFTGASTANESYTYDADGERVVRSVATGVTTYYIGGIYEEDMPNGVTRSMYSLNGQVVAQRMVNPSLFAPIITYLHSDHLGSVSVATDPSGNPVSSQEYDPWGAVISGGVSQTAINYTGQRLDATGLLYYHARYYDPALGKFLTPDSIVPDGAPGKEGSTRLTVDFHEAGFVTSLQGENQQILSKGFWFQLSGQDKQRAKEPWGPGNPQSLNRYAYALNDPIRYSDPLGHFVVTRKYAADFALALKQLIADWSAIAANHERAAAYINGLASLEPTGALAAFVSAIVASADPGNAREMIGLLNWVLSWVEWLASNRPGADDSDYLDFRLHYYVSSMSHVGGPGPLYGGRWIYRYAYEATVFVGACNPPTSQIPGYPTYSYSLSEDLYKRLAGYIDPQGRRPWVVQGEFVGPRHP